MTKLFLTPHEKATNEELVNYLEQENVDFQEDEKEWDGENLDLKKRILVEELPSLVKEILVTNFYGEELVEDAQLDKEIGIMQLATLKLDEESNEYYLMNQGYYVYGRNGWDVEQYLDFHPTPESESWIKEILEELEKVEWKQVAA